LFSVSLDECDDDDSSDEPLGLDDGGDAPEKDESLWPHCRPAKNHPRGALLTSGPINTVKFGMRLRRSRIDAELAIEDACELLELSEEQYKTFERGYAIPNLGLIVKMADTFSVQIDYLLGRLNDGLAEPEEARFGVQMHSFRKAFEAITKGYANAAAEHYISCNSTQAQVAEDAARLISRIAELQAAYGRMKELNPSFDDEVRGAPRVEAAINALDIEASGLQLCVEQVERAKRFAMIQDGTYIEPQGVRCRSRRKQAAGPELET
jgi:transcriptional regulator with XRE-family HTH domain